MSKINLSHTESKVLRTLVEDSRLNVNDIANITNLNRNTVRAAIKNLVSNKIITRFTVDVAQPEDERLVLIETENGDQIPDGDKIAVLSLANGKYMVISRLDVLKKGIRYTSVNIIDRMEDFKNLSATVRVYCDFCGKEIKDEVLVVKQRNHEYYACCENCKTDLAKRLSREEKSIG